jgi:predicted Zn-dependent peptidase
MKRLILIAALPFALALPAPAQDDLKLPPVERFVTSNGIQVVCIRDELPKITVSASVCAGYLYETPANAGLTDVTARLLNISGTKAHPQEALDLLVDATGSRYSVRPDWETVTVSFQALDEFSDLACETVSGILCAPAFADQQFELARSLQREKISREDQDPFAAAYGRARTMLFEGKGYGVRATSASVSSLKLDDLKKVWSSSVKGGNIVLAVASPRPAKDIKVLVEKYFASIPKGSRAEYSSSLPSKEHIRDVTGSVYFIERAIPQSTVILCAPAPGVADQRSHALRVADEILGGGGFNAKLTTEIREKRGLAYSTGSVIRMRKNAGVFISYAQCDAVKTAETMELMNGCVAQMNRGEFTAEDLTLSTQSIARSYVFEFDTPANVLSHYLSLWYNALPDSYLSEYTRKILAQDNASVKAAFASLTQKGVVTVVIGNASARTALEAKGKVVLLPDEKR